MGVSVGGGGVKVGVSVGIGVSVGGSGVTVGVSGVAVGGTGVAAVHDTRKDITKSNEINCKILLFISPQDYSCGFTEMRIGVELALT